MRLSFRMLDPPGAWIVSLPYSRGHLLRSTPHLLGHSDCPCVCVSLSVCLLWVISVYVFVWLVGFPARQPATTATAVVVVVASGIN